jgi:hypothetical protein
MGVLLFMLAIFGLTAGFGTAAEAQIIRGDVGDAAYNCGFISHEQCMATVRGIGGFCNANTQYVSPTAPVPRGRKHS